jgi:hypothetical protein
MKELIVALDLEMNQPSGRVVQIGAVLGNVRTGEVVSQLDLKVNPGEPLFTSPPPSWRHHRYTPVLSFLGRKV